jgi:hypothetical protein
VWAAIARADASSQVVAGFPDVEQPVSHALAIAQQAKPYSDAPDGFAAAADGLRGNGRAEHGDQHGVETSGSLHAFSPGMCVMRCVRAAGAKAA